MPSTKFTKSHDKQIAGVCGGIADFLGWDSKKIRILWLVGVLFSMGITILVNMALAYMFPDPPDKFDLDKYRVQ